MSEAGNLSDRIDALDAHAAAAAVELLAELLAAAPRAVEAGIGLDGLEPLIEAAERDPSAPLGGVDPAGLSRGLLKAYAADRDYAPLIAEVVAHAGDAQLATKPILAVGVAASLVIVAASTDVRIKFHGVEVHKSVASPELVRSAGGLFEHVLPSLAPKRGGAAGTGRLTPR